MLGFKIIPTIQNSHSIYRGRKKLGKEFEKVSGYSLYRTVQAAKRIRKNPKNEWVRT